MKTIISTILACGLCLSLVACDEPATLEAQTREIVRRTTAELGMPAIVNFQEKRMAKQIYEMRDNAIATHTYLVNEMRGCLVYMGPSVGFGLPYATQYSNPEVWHRVSGMTLPQAEPNGLYMPGSAEGTWVMLKDPTSNNVKPIYVEPRIVVSPFKMVAGVCS